MECIKDMINRLCPNGVKQIKLADCLKYEQPTKYQVSSKDYVEKGIPVLTAGQTFILGYTNETNGVYQASKEKPVIIFDDFTTSFHWVDFNFKVKSSAMKMLTPFNEEVNFRYIYYAMKCINYETLEHSRQWISTYSQFEIPLPPLEIQNRIVEVLDKMTELEAELEARKQQYEYYRNKLLTFSEIGGGKFVRLGDVCIVGTGSGNRQDATEDGKYPFFVRSKKVLLNDNYEFDEEAILIPGEGGIGDIFHYYKGKYALHQRTYRIHPISDAINTKFLYYYMFANFKKFILMKAVSATVTSIRKPMIETFEVPIPPLEEQARIVSILDRFEALTTDLQTGLPAEIEARRQQYEYYRNKLLTFKHTA